VTSTTIFPGRWSTRTEESVAAWRMALVHNSETITAIWSRRGPAAPERAAST
jgi:hypothetical protein